MRRAAIDCRTVTFPSATTSLTRRRLLLAAGAAALGACAVRPPPVTVVPASARLRLLAETTLPHRLEVEGTMVGGLSGLDFDPASGLWVAMSDDRSELQPARFYTLRVNLEPRRLAVEPASAVILRQANGQPYPPRHTRGEVVDPEAVRLLPGRGTLLWTSEGDLRVNQPPAVHESRLDGRYLRSFQVPPLLHFANRPGSGPRDNETFEGLALTPDARTAWVSMESALQQDGPRSSVRAPGGPCRFTAFDVASGRALRQIAYLSDAVPIAPKVPGTYADNGVAELLMRDERRLLVLERAYALGTGNSVRLYEIDTGEASDTLGLGRLEPGRFRAATKRLVADLGTLGLSRLDNIEGMCWGPRLPDGSRTLVVVSDDNFNATQVTQFAAFAFLE